MSRADFNKVSECVSHNDILNQLGSMIAKHNRGIEKDYHNIFAAIHEKINIAPSCQVDRMRTKEVLGAYQLSAKLQVAANNAWSRISSYQTQDSIATSAENEARFAFGCSEERKKELDSRASDLRYGATIAKHRATDQIGYVNSLVKQLDAQVQVVQNHLRAPIYSQDVKNRLDGAAWSIHSYDFWEKLTGCNTGAWGFFHNLAELSNSFAIQDELDSIGRNAGGIKSQLESALVNIFTNERALHTEDNILASADTLNNPQAQQAAAKYLNAWAKPGIWEHL